MKCVCLIVWVTFWVSITAISYCVKQMYPNELTLNKANIAISYKGLVSIFREIIIFCVFYICMWFIPKNEKRRSTSMWTFTFTYRVSEYPSCLCKSFTFHLLIVSFQYLIKPNGLTNTVLHWTIWENKIKIKNIVFKKSSRTNFETKGNAFRNILIQCATKWNHKIA